MAKTNEYEAVEKWLSERNVEEVEVLVGDFAGITRGKKKPVDKFISALGGNILRMPDSIFGTTVDCNFVENDHITELEEDVFLVPDIDTAGMVPWNDRPTAYFICDVMNADGTTHDMAPRQVLKNVLKLYADKGWKAVVAPEFEFTLLAQSEGPSQEAPIGRSGQPVVSRGVMSLDGISEFGAMFDDVNRYCALMGLPMDALVQEAGVAQFEFNISHGDPVKLADSAFQFKRIMKWAAVKHGFHASFMAKPYAEDFGNAMHMHQSIVDLETGENVFADDAGKDTALFHSHIAGLQKYMSASMPFFAPYENSYLRLSNALSSPVNTHWGLENRTVGLRVPEGGKLSRRIENRIAGSDVNPYLALAASLACGYLGMVENLTPTDAIVGSAYDLPGHKLPQHIYASLDALDESKALRRVLGEAFVTTYIDIKKSEIAARARVLSSWDIEYLLTNV